MPLPYRPGSGGEHAIAMVAANEGGGGGGYNPDQPRDGHGRWTSGGGGEGGGSDAPPPGSGPKEPPTPPPPPPQAKKGVPELIKQAQEQGGWLSTGPDKGSKECVALVKTAVPELGSTDKWKAGEPVTPGDPNLKPGTPIGTGWNDKGEYPNNSSGNHVGIFDGWDPKTGEMKILDQNSGPTKSAPNRQEKPAGISRKAPDKASQYRVIRRK